MIIDVPYLYNQVRPFAIAVERKRSLLDENPDISEDALHGRVFAATVVEVAGRLGIVPGENDSGEFKAEIMELSTWIVENMGDGINALVSPKYDKSF